MKNPTYRTLKPKYRSVYDSFDIILYGYLNRYMENKKRLEPYQT